MIFLSSRDGRVSPPRRSSQRLHREALANAADPVAALLASYCSYPRREGYVWVSRKTRHKRRSLFVGSER